MHPNTHSYHSDSVEEEEEEEEEKTFLEQTNTPSFNAHSKTYSEHTHQQHYSEQTGLHSQESIVYPYKSQGVSLSWLHKQKEVKPLAQSLDFSCDDHIANCEAIKRIVRVLEFYKSHQTTLLNNEESVIPLFEHISSVKNYGISMFMEDWYQCKKNHFKTPNDIQHFQSIEAIKCDDESCVYVRRYQRDRTVQQDPNKEIDYKNLILMDAVNSIHTFIFHWMPSRFNNIETSSLNLANIEEDSDTDDDTAHNIDIYGSDEHDAEDEKELENELEIDLWPNGPTPMSQCNVDQIVFLLKHEIVDQVTKLKPHKDAIIKYIKDNAFNGNKLSQTKRIKFAAELVDHFKNKKLRMSFAKLYKHIWDYNDPQYVTPEPPKHPKPSAPTSVTMNNDKFVTTNNNNSSELSYFAL
eukprot:917363_1